MSISVHAGDSFANLAHLTPSLTILNNKSRSIMGIDGKEGMAVIGELKPLVEESSIRGAGLRPRLSDVLLEGHGRSFDSIVTLPSNVQAVESALLFATGRSRLVAIVGPSGWGKSHLVEASSHTLSVLDRDARPQVLDGKEWLNPGLRLDPLAPLLVDDAQVAMGLHKARLQFRLALERRVKAGRPVLLAISAPKPTRALRAFLPNHHAWVIATIEPPTAAERAKVVAQMARVRGLALSESLQLILAKHLTGDGRTFEGAFKRLRLQDTRWLDAGSTIRALGILNPFFVDNATWDLREAIWAVAEQRCRTNWNRDLATYVMLRVAQLPESDVAHFFETEPKAAYTRAQAFQKTMEGNDEVRLAVREFLEVVVDRLRTGG